MKTFKETFNAWYKRERKYTGTIWSGRFASALVDGGRYRAICMRYVYFNPIRAGIVTRAADYAWSWMAAPEAPFAGVVPDGWLMGRVAQIGGGKVFGSEAFVAATAFALGDRFRSRHVSARAVGGWDLRRTDGSSRRRPRHELDARNPCKKGLSRGLSPGGIDYGYCEWNGRLAAVTNAGGFVVQYAYDVMDRVTNISWRTTGGATLGGFAYGYDELGRITSRSHTLGDPSQPSPMSQSSQRTYAYDDFDRLVSDGDVAYTHTTRYLLGTLPINPQ